MKRFLKLIDFEINRFIKHYIILIGIMIALQIIAIVVGCREYIRTVKSFTHGELIATDAFLEQYDKMSFFQISSSMLFVVSIVLGIVVLAIYIFFIWYREWLGKSRFSYRLLVLPVSRIQVYLAKAITILILTLGLVALQIILLPIEIRLFETMIPDGFRYDATLSGIINSSNYYGGTLLPVLVPESIIALLLYYSGGMTVVFVTFTAILFERSFGWKGILMGIIYGSASFIVFLLPIILNETILNSYFYENEVFYIEIGITIVILIVAIWIGNYLINKKVRV